MKYTWLNRFSLGAIAALLLLLASPSAQAQVKLGTVDMKKVFDSYYKTKQADTQIKDRAADSEKVYKGMVEDYQRANEEYRKLIESSNDQAVSSVERENRKKSAESKLNEVQEIEKSVKQFQAQARSTLGELEKRLRDAIVKDIRELIATKSKAGNYTMILDISAQSLYQTPVVLQSISSIDISDELIKEINVGAPPGTLSPAGAATPGAK